MTGRDAAGKGGGALRVFVTGANGFVGSSLVRHLSESGRYRVSGLVRRTSELFRLEGLSGSRRLELIRGSLDEVTARSLEGFDAVVHTAAKSSDWGRREEFERANVTGTERLLDASIAAGVRRFVHISSVVVYGFHGAPALGEDRAARPFGNPYCLTKAEAEKRAFARRDRIELVVLRPSNVFGPGDTKFTLPALKSIERGLVGFPRGGRALTSPCYIGNLTHAAEMALLAEGGLGEAYNVTDGRDVTWSEFLSMIAAEMGRKPPRIPLPAGPLYALAAVLETLFVLSGSSRPPLITPYRIAQAASDYSFSIEKARRVLGYEPPWETLEGVRESVKWYRGGAPAGQGPAPR